MLSLIHCHSLLKASFEDRVSSLFCCQAQAGLHRTGIALHPFKMSEELFPEPEWLSEEVKTGVSYRLMGLQDVNEWFISSYMKTV